MGFKFRVFGETIILCILLILDTQNFVSGCQLLMSDGTPIPLDDSYTTVELGEFPDDEPPRLLSSFSYADIPSITKVSGKYLESTYNNTVINIWISDSYIYWERNERDDFLYPNVVLELGCSPIVTVEFLSKISKFTNNYDPEFPDSSYKIELPMPLPAGYNIVGGCGEVIEVADYDYHIQYKSDVEFSLKDPTPDLEVTGLKIDYEKKWAVSMKTTSTFRIEKPLTVTVVAKEVPPEGLTDVSHTSEVEITIVPNITATTPASPLFDSPIYIFDIKQVEDIQPQVATLVEGGTANYEAKLSYVHGEDLVGFFDIDTDGAVITLTPKESLAITEFSGNFGVLILEAEHPGTNRKGKTVIHVTLPGNYVTPPPCTTKPTEESTYNTEESTQTSAVTCEPETTVTSIECTCPPPTTYCPTEEPPTTSPSTSDTISTTTTVNTPTCEPCVCTPGTPECSTAPPQEKNIHFTDPEAIVYIYEQQMGYIKTMRAFCIPECEIKYEILSGTLSNSLIIDGETGNINITENIKESGLFEVIATTEIDGINYEETATVHLNLMTLQPCQNGSYWKNALTVKSVKENLKSPYIVENCDVIEGCKCSIVKVIPKEARDYFIDGGDVTLITSIDREDPELFQNQSNTYIILHLELSCESDEKTIYKFWDRRSLSAIDYIGNIEYNASRTVIVLQIEDEDDNLPEFDAKSITVGYPSAKTVHQLLPPYLMKVQATDADFGENAIIKYSLEPKDRFFIHQDTGVIYPVAEGFIYEDTKFKVYASDSNDPEKALEVTVRILTPEHLLVVKQNGSVLEDVNAVMDIISSRTEYNIKLFSAAVIADDTVVKDAVHKKDDRQLTNLKSTDESTSSLLQLIIYGLDNVDEKPVHNSYIQKDLEGRFPSEPWAGSNTIVEEPNESSDSSLLIAVIVLAAVMLLLLCGAGFVYLRYVRSRRNNNNNYYDKMLNNNDSSSISEVEVIQPSTPPSLHLSTPQPEQELVNMTEPNEFNQGTTDVKNTANNGDGGEHEDDENSEKNMKRKRSVVTFNENVEKIEIEEV